MNVKDYIKQHDDVGYCEAIIYPNGNIEDAIPGHTYKLMSITNKSRKEIDEMIPNNASPLDWLLGYTKCIALWYDFLKYDSITKEQLNTIQELVNHNILNDVIIGIHTDEFTRCDLLNKFYNGEIDDVPEKTNDKIYIYKKKLDNIFLQA
jgi:hypothetical protein